MAETLDCREDLLDELAQRCGARLVREDGQPWDGPSEAGRLALEHLGWSRFGRDRELNEFDPAKHLKEFLGVCCAMSSKHHEQLDAIHKSFSLWCWRWAVRECDLTEFSRALSGSGYGVAGNTVSGVCLKATMQREGAAKREAKRTEMVKAFVQACCRTGAGLRVVTRDLHRRFLEWSSDKPGPKCSPGQFGRALAAAGYGRDPARPRLQYGRIWRGLDLATNSGRDPGADRL